jgi:hypothetical protein
MVLDPPDTAAAPDVAGLLQDTVSKRATATSTNTETILRDFIKYLHTTVAPDLPEKENVRNFFMQSSIIE